jgi:23S rRNA (uracil1939-C5)-methyltransferase
VTKRKSELPVTKQQPPVKRGGIYDIDIQGLGHSGEGVGRYQNFTVFVPFALPGERVSVGITAVKKNYAKGELLKIETAAPERIEAQCPIYRRCGGCQMQHLEYEAQLEVKRQQVIDAMERIGKLEHVTVHPVIGAQNPWYYRNKMQFPVGAAGRGVAIGCFAQGTHEIINTENCLIQHQSNNLIVREVRTIAERLGITPYDEETGSGILRHVLGRIGTRTGEVMVVLVTAAAELPRKEQIIAEIKQHIPGVVSLIQNINPKRTNIILGDRTVTLWGKDTITDYMGDFAFEISARSFFQVNSAQAEILYRKAVEYACLTGRETVIDAYCGTGTISLFLAQGAAKVYGIEIVEPAVRDARRNAERNHITSTEFIAGDATRVMPELYQQGVRPAVIVVDPPRAGCEQTVLETFAHLQPERIVYVSCNPASLARDLAILQELGYETVEIQPVDMFPQTYHVECVAMIERK